MSKYSRSKSKLSLKQQELVKKRLAQRAHHIPRQPHNGSAPASLSQIRLWLENEMAPNTAVYNINRRLHLTGKLDVAALEKSLNAIVRRHETLRTTFRQQGDQIVQQIQPALTLDMPLIDLRAAPTQQVEKMIAAEAKRPFSLTAGPLIRTRLFRPDECEHILLLTIHHIIADGWSMRVFWQEFNQLYAAFVNGQTPTLSPLPIQYVDFTRWQEQQLQGDRLQQQLTYWREKLDGIPTRLDLPVDRPRPAQQSFRGAVHTFTLPADLLQSLQQLSQEREATLFMTLLAAFQVFLSRYSGQTDIVIGSPVAGRNHTDLNNLIGFFINTIVLRGNLSNNPPFYDYLSHMREVVIEALAHQETPLEKLVEELQPDRNLNHAPIFQVIFTIQNTPETKITLPGLDCQLSAIHSDTAKVDLTLFVGESEEGLICTWEYDAALFNETTIQRMTSNWQTLLNGIVANPRWRVAELPLLSQEEVQLLTAWNDTDTPYPQEINVHHLFEAQVVKAPHQMAIVAAEGQISYGELNRRANQLAHYLQEQGVTAETRVGICLERSPLTAVAALAVWKAGGAYVPLDPTYPAGRLAYMLADSGSLLLLTTQNSNPELTNLTIPRLFLDDWAPLDTYPTKKPATFMSLDHLAYVIYTSGSTGQPKGVAVAHRSLAHMIAWYQGAYDLSCTDKSTMTSGPAFDATIWELWPYLTTGATIYIPDEETRVSPSRLRDWILNNKITVSYLPTPLTDAIVQLDWPDDSSLRLLITGGDVLHRYPSERLPFALANNYGPTENTVVSTFIILTPAAKLAALPPVGKPVANTQIYLLDAHMQPVPVGAVGELYIGGEQLARGYWRRPSHTAESFIPNSFGDQPGTRLYRTGDLARYLPDGNIEFIGRADLQVKIRGFRIELGEIESVLSQHPGVSEAVVTVHEEAAGNKRLIAYLVIVNPDLAVDQLRTYLQMQLPDYMVPAAFVPLPTIPLTANGKIDRKALPVPAGLPAESEKYVAPTTAVEQTIAAIWEEVMGLEQVGVHDNFFELGGHSLLATQIIGRVREQLQQDVPLLTLFQFPTIAGLAGTLTSVPMTAIPTAINTTLRQEAQQSVMRTGQACIALPVSFAQQRLWLLDQLEPNSPLYNIPFPIELQGELDENALEMALADLVARHESLRTTFEMVDEILMQIIHPANLPDLPFVTDDQIEQQIAAEASRPFDLMDGPLMRATLYRHEFDKHTLLLVFHHIVIDGWSMPIFLDELIALYEEYAEGTPASLAPLPVQYADYALWQREWLQGDRFADQLQYWREQLAHAPATLKLPADRPRTSIQTFAGDAVLFHLPPQLALQIKSVSQQLDMTPYMIGLTAVYILLYRYARQTDIVVGSPTANRTLPEQETLIGFFVNMLTLRADLSDNPTVEKLLAQVRDTVAAAQSRQDIPFEKLVNDLGLERTLSHAPLFQVVFTYDVGGNRQIERPSLTWTPRDLGVGLVKYDLMLGLRESEQGIEGVISYNSDLFDRATIQRMAANWQTVLASVIAKPHQPVMTLPLLSKKERQQQLTIWNDTRIPYPQNTCVHRLFETQAAQTPQQTALVFAHEEISYEELNRRANQLAHHLRRLGVEQETLVGLSLGRSVEMIVGILAILKAGGAYLPLDAAYPAERLAYMLRDGQVDVLLTQESLRNNLPVNEQMTVLCPDSEWDRIAAECDVNLPDTAVSTNLAYVMYTSGSTGRPKGVAITHRNIIRLVKEANFARLTAGETFLQFAPISFDAATLEIWGSLLNGARLVIAPPQQLSLTELADLIQSQAVTTLWLTAGLFHLVVDDHLSALSGLRQLMAGGDVLSLPRIQRMLQELPACQMINGYGPTENTTFTTCCPLSPAEILQTTAPIGSPVSNTQVYVLDENLELAPVGVPGELYTGGDGLARGYLNQPGLTAISFLPHPFAQKPGERLYRTGDMVRWLDNGRLEFLGRRDKQVKIRGYRVEQAEIETILSQHPDVRQSVVLALTSPAGDKYLAAYILSEANVTAVDKLQQYLTRRLPDYMVPTSWVMLDEFPLNANGKVDRHALPEPDLSRRQVTTEFAQPATPAESILVEIWTDVLGIDPIGIHDNFFELGGDSILIIRIVAKAKDAGLPLAVRQLFQHQTIAELAAVVGEDQETAVTPIEIITNALAPLTPIQQWFFEQSLAQPNHWNMAILLETDQPLQKERLEQAVAELAAHHDALRMQFVQTDAGWQQRHTSRTNGDWLRWFTGIDDAASLIAEQQASLNISQGPLFRAAYFDRGSQPHQLLLVIHHLVMDGISWRILLEDLQAAYEQITRGTAVTLPAKTTSFHRWAQTLSQHVQSDQFTPDIDYWLDDTPAPNRIPLDNPAGSNTVASEAVLTYALTPDETNALLHNAPAAYNMRIDEILLTALAQAHHAWTGCSSLLVNLEGHGREDALPNRDITRTIGWFTTLYPVRLQLPGTVQPGDALKAIKEQVRQIPGRGMTYGLLRYLHPDHELREELARRETAVISFNYLGQFNEQTDAGAFRIVGGASASSFAPENQRPHILDVGGMIHNRQLQLHLHYSRELHHEQTIAQFGDGLMRCLHVLIKHCQSPQAQGYTPSDFDKVTLSQGELDDILAELDTIF